MSKITYRKCTATTQGGEVLELLVPFKLYTTKRYGSIYRPIDGIDYMFERAFKQWQYEALSDEQLKVVGLHI